MCICAGTQTFSLIASGASIACILLNVNVSIEHFSSFDNNFDGLPSQCLAESPWAHTRPPGRFGDFEKNIPP